MKLRILLATLAALLLAAPALAETKAYALGGDISTQFPTDGTIMHPGVSVGSMVLEDDEGGTVTLRDYVVRTAFTDIVGGTIITMIPGTTVVLDNDTTLRIDTGQTGTGSIRGELNWGVLTNWTQTGRLYCNTRCPGGCGPASSCIPFINFEGTGPPTPLKSVDFYTDTWVFDDFANAVRQGLRCAGGSAIGGGEPNPTDPNDPSVCQQDSDCPGNCTDGQGNATFPCPCTDTLEIIFIEPIPTVIVRAYARVVSNPVPAVPLLGVAGLGAALLYLGARAIRRRSR